MAYRIAVICNFRCIHCLNRLNTIAYLSCIEIKTTAAVCLRSKFRLVFDRLPQQLTAVHGCFDRNPVTTYTSTAFRSIRPFDWVIVTDYRTMDCFTDRENQHLRLAMDRLEVNSGFQHGTEVGAGTRTEIVTPRAGGCSRRCDMLTVPHFSCALGHRKEDK